MDKKTEEEKQYTEQYAGIIMLRKGRYDDKDVWFGTIGNQLVSDGVFESKQQLIENLSDLSLERVCKMIAGAFERAITYKKD